MATLISIANGNFTAASTWSNPLNELDGTPTTTNTTVTTSLVGNTAFALGISTINGLAVKVGSRFGTTGTFTMDLFNSTTGLQVPGSSVTINMTDVPRSGWFQTQFTGIVLGVGNYQVRCRTSTANQLSLATSVAANANWSNEVITNTATGAAPAAGDKIIVLGSYTAAATLTTITVTNNNTATTSFGNLVATYQQAFSVSMGGVFQYGTTASTAYYFKLKGLGVIFDGGSFIRGTSGTPIPSSSSAIYEFDPTVNGDSTLIFQNGFTYRDWGAAVTTMNTTLTATAASAQKVVKVVSTAGWVSGDTIVLASTSLTRGECESGVINTVDSSTQVTLVGNLGFTHTLPVISPEVCEVTHMTRNNKFRGTTSLLQGSISTAAAAIGVVDTHNVEFTRMNSCLQLNTFVPTTQALILGCTMHDCTVAASTGLNTNNSATGSITINDFNTFNIANAHLNITTTTNPNINVQRVICMLNIDGSTDISTLGMSDYTNSTVSDIYFVGSTQNGVTVSTVSTSKFPKPVITNIGGHANGSGSGEGVSFSSICADLTLNNVTTWRNASAGMNFALSSQIFNMTINNLLSVGNGNNILIGTSHSDITINNGTIAGDSTFSSAQGINFLQSTINQGIIRLNNVQLGVVSGTMRAHITNDIGFPSGGVPVQIIGNNVSLASATQLGAVAAGTPVGGFVKIERLGGVAGTHKSWFKLEPTTATLTTIENDTSVFRTAAPSQKITPAIVSSGVKVSSASFFVPVINGTTTSGSVWVQKSAAYNGAQPRLMLRANYSLGVTADTVLGTASGGTGSFLQITGTTPSATDDGTWEIYVDCDGSAGTVNVDDFSVTSSLPGTGGFNYWKDGLNGPGYSNPSAPSTGYVNTF